MVKRKKKNSKTLKNNNGLAKIATITTKSLSNAFSNYKKNKELGKIKAIKLISKLILCQLKIQDSLRNLLSLL